MRDQSNSDPKRDESHADLQPPSVPPPQNETVLPNPEENEPHSRIHATVNSPSKARPIEWLQLALNAALAVIGVFAICIYGGQLHVMRESLRQLEVSNNVTQRTLEAVIGSFGVGLSGDRRTVSWHFQNDGTGVAANNVAWTAQLKATRIGDGTVIQMETAKYDSPTKVLAGFPVTSQFALNDRISPDLGQEVIRVTVSVQYDSGFGTVVHGSYCRELVGDTGVNGPRRTLYIGDYDCAASMPFIERRREQLGLN